MNLKCWRYKGMIQKVYLISKSWWKREAEATLNMFRWGCGVTRG